MNIADICTQEVVFADRGDSLQQAASLMREPQLRAVRIPDYALASAE